MIVTFSYLKHYGSRTIKLPPAASFLLSSENLDQTRKIIFSVLNSFCKKCLIWQLRVRDTIEITKISGWKRLSISVYLPQFLKRNLIEITFLDASSHLYMRVCPSVCPSVRPSVGPLALSKNRRRTHLIACPGLFFPPRKENHPKKFQNVRFREKEKGMENHLSLYLFHVLTGTYHYNTRTMTDWHTMKDRSTLWTVRGLLGAV